MKGIILAGGSGTRLYPITKEVSKQLLPIYDKPMIYYPLSVLMLAGIKDILIISTPTDTEKFARLLGDGSNFGIKLSYLVQPEPKGLAQAFTIGKEFIGEDNVAMILGDNIFYGDGLQDKLYRAIDNADKGLATIFSYHVPDPERFGVVEFDKEGKAISIEEKPTNPKSNYASNLEPSERGEYEITDVNRKYLEDDTLFVETLGRGYSWLDTGTFDSLNEASDFVKTVQKNGQMIACLEEIAYLNGWITKDKVKEIGMSMAKNAYGKYLIDLANRDLEKDPVRMLVKKKEK